MPTNRELYFRHHKEGISESIINFVLKEINGFDHLLLTQNFDQEIKDCDAFEEAIERYKKGEMIEYVFNKAYFLSHPFYVDNNVLIPRQETEQLVIKSIERIIKKFNTTKLNIGDVCTGSGVIGISVAKTLNDSAFFLTDISKVAIRVAEINIKQFGLNNVKTYIGDMLEPFANNNIKLDVMMCNPPYIEDIATIDQKTWNQEPHISLFAKPSTKYYEIILQNYRIVMKENFLLCFEIGEDMETSLTAIIKKYCPEAIYSFEKDLYEKNRFLFIENDNK